MLQNYLRQFNDHDICNLVHKLAETENKWSRKSVANLDLFTDEYQKKCKQ
jgi:hypothetical protein